LQEYQRVLYVALTRAKEGLTLLFDGKTEKNSWAESCLLNMTAGVHVGEWFAYEVLTGPFEAKILSRQELQTGEDPGPWKLSVEQEVRQTMAVTRMIAEQNASAAESQTFRPTQALQKALAKAYRGTEAHRIFESLKYTETETVLAGLEDDAMKEAVRFIVSAKEAPLGEIIANGFAEWGFSFREDGVWVQGQIDLWGEVDGKIWLVDYKTGSSEHSDQAFQQLGAYAWALRRMNFIKADDQAVNFAVVYPFEKAVRVRLNQKITPPEKTPLAAGFLG
ncbi:MAG: exonuclease RexA, partial [Proteobacteria bacterium]